jgi:hypothetical protein
MDSNKSEWIDLKTASEYSATSISWLRRQIKDKRLQCARTGKNGGKILLKRDWIDALLKSEVK